MTASPVLRLLLLRLRRSRATLLVAGVGVLSAVGSLAAQRGTSGSARPAAAPAVVELRIAATTDIHGRVRGWDYFGDSTESGRGMARVATIVDSLRAAHPAGTILVDAGDFMQGNALTFVASRPGFTGVNPVIAAMNALKYDAVVLGNHEFNYGLATLDRALAPATFPVLAANARRIDGKKQWAPTTYVTRGGVRIAIIGVTTPWAMVWDRDLLRGKVVIDDIVQATRRAVADARRGGAHVVVVVGHSGMGAATDDSLPGIPPENAMAAVAREVPGIDLIVVGHTHRELADTTINGVMLMQPRNWATSVAVAAIRVEREGRAWKIASKRGSIVRAAGHAEKPAVLPLSEAGHNAARGYVNAVIGTTATEWRTDSARTMDMPIIDFIGETMRRATGADLASTAVFSTNIRFTPGNISVARLAQLYPYDNTIRVLRFTGARLKDYLEQSARYFRVTGTGDSMRAAPDPAFIGFNFEVVTGAEYAIDLSRPVGDRITGLTVRGRPVAPADSFSIALTNYRASGTGGYGMIAGAPIVKDDGRDIRQLLIDEVTRRKELRAADFFTSSWRVVPAALAAQVQAAIGGQADFDAVRRPPVTNAPTGQAGRASVLRLISTNDFHGGLEPRTDGAAGRRGGAAQLATVIRRLERECTGGCASLLVDGGDLFQGTPASNLAFGRPVIALFNALGHVAAALGNHDLDWGQDTLRARMRDARFAILAANITDPSGNRVPWIRPDTLVERGGVRIGIVGLALQGTPATQFPRNIAGLRFLPAGPVVIERAAGLRARGAQLVIVIAHAGAVCDSTCRGDMADVAMQAGSSIDAIVGGHNHIEFNAVVNGVPIMRGRSSGRAVAVLDLPMDRAARGAVRPQTVFVATDSVMPDPEITRIVDAAVAPVAELARRPIATIAEDMRRGVPQHAVGNFIADAQRAATGAEIAFMNNGGIRTDLRAGPAGYGTFFELSPFGNALVRLTVTGAQLQAYLERVVWRGTPNAHVSGLTARYDPTRPQGGRVIDVTVGGQPLSATRNYVISMSDFMASGGDGLSLAGVPTVDTGIIDLDALIAFAEAQPGGIVRPDRAIRIARVEP